MRTDFKSIIELLDYYKDEETCKKLFAQQRWGDSPACPHCGSLKPYVTNRGYKCSAKECRKKFTVTVGTIFENSKIKLRVWFAAMYFITAHKKGISSCQLATDLNISQSSAWFILHRIRETLKDEAPAMLCSVVEVDETFVGGKNKNRHADKKIPNSQGRSGKDKTPVFGALQRSAKGSKVSAKPVTDTSGATLIPIIEGLVAKGSIMVSDEWGAYNGLTGKDYRHAVINHNSGEYVRGYIHTNGIENFWSLLKRGIIGIYHHVSPKHLHRYCNEFTYRYNDRDLKADVRFQNTLKLADGKRLRYVDLVAN